jgi:hypothetical protein
MSLCIVAGGKLAALAVSAFTLGWVHSVERVAWEEDWHVTLAGLVLIEARVKGSGAGMEPGPGAVLAGGWWRWRPEGVALAELVLAASGATGAGWTLCHAGGCLAFGAAEGPPVRLYPCPD